jgi:formamidopyrimidine-DNA glycosylase
MPELPEAETMARDLDRKVAGRKILRTAVSYPPIVATGPESGLSILEGLTIIKVDRLGKLVRFHLEKGYGLIIQLKMTGQFLFGQFPKKDSDWPRHARAALALGGQPVETLFYRDMRKFGRLHALSPEKVEERIQAFGLGPDPLQIGPKEFHDLVSSKKGELKAVLMNQSVISGIGNIYATEGLFAAGLSPLRPANTLSPKESAILHEKTVAILKEAIDLRGSTVDNYEAPDGKGAFQENHLAYGKAGSSCPKCGTLFERDFVAGRTSIHCPKCQK